MSTTLTRYDVADLSDPVATVGPLTPASRAFYERSRAEVLAKYAGQDEPEDDGSFGAPINARVARMLGGMS